MTWAEHRFAGEPQDSDIEMQYMRARFLVNKVGRFLCRDTFEGVPEKPLTRHPYVYAAANPVTYTDPSGLFPPLIWGREVHKEIGKDFVSAASHCRSSDLRLATIAGLPSTKEEVNKAHFLLMRPDLVDTCNDKVGEVYEIKTTLGYYIGTVQLRSYITYLRFITKGRKWKTGTNYDPSHLNPLKLSLRAYAYVLPPLNGVITYQVFVNSRPVMMEATSIAAVMATAQVFRIAVNALRARQAVTQMAHAFVRF
jgi:RHS repeat-associated protein